MRKFMLDNHFVMEIPSFESPPEDWYGVEYIDNIREEIQRKWWYSIYYGNVFVFWKTLKKKKFRKCYKR